MLIFFNLSLLEIVGRFVDCENASFFKEKGLYIKLKEVGVWPEKILFL